MRAESTTTPAIARSYGRLIQRKSTFLLPLCRRKTTKARVQGLPLRGVACSLCASEYMHRRPAYVPTLMLWLDDDSTAAPIRCAGTINYVHFPWRSARHHLAATVGTHKNDFLVHWQLVRMEILSSMGWADERLFPNIVRLPQACVDALRAVAQPDLGVVPPLRCPISKERPCSAVRAVFSLLHATGAALTKTTRINGPERRFLSDLIMGLLLKTHLHVCDNPCVRGACEQPLFGAMHIRGHFPPPSLGVVCLAINYFQRKASGA